MKKLIVYFIFSCFAFNLSADDTGFVLGGTAVSVPGGDVSWTNPSNVLLDDSNEASALNLGTGDLVDFMKVTNFTWPETITGTIDGVEIKYQVRADGSSDMSEFSVRLVVNDVNSGNDKTENIQYTNILTDYTRGGATDTWGLSLSPADVNASNFGVAIQTEDCCAGSGDDIWMQAVWIKVYYTPTTPISTTGSGGSISTEGSGGTIITE